MCVCAEQHINKLFFSRAAHNSESGEKGQLCRSSLDFGEQCPPQCLLVNTQTHSHNSLGMPNKDSIVKKKKKDTVHVCACTRAHTDVYACMCMFINTPTLSHSQREREQRVNLTESFFTTER